MKVIATVVAVAVIGGGYWLYNRFGTAHLVIESDPPGAFVSVDRRQIGVTPVRISIDAGRHLLEAQHTHYESYSESVSLGRGDRFERKIVFQPGKGTLRLVSNPKGAWVEVDGVRLEEPTPVRFESRSGPLLVRMGLPERFPVEKTVTLNANAALDVNFDLNMDPHGSLTVLVSPAGASVELPEEEVKYRPGVRLPMGERLMRVSKRGYVTQEIRYKINYGDNLQRVTLKRDYGSLNVLVTPRDAEITVSYRAEGGRWLRQPFEKGMRVPVGDVEVRARSMGYRTGYSEFNLTNAGRKLNLRLLPVDVEPGVTFRDKLTDGGESPELIVIPAGSFVMGDADGPPSENPPRTVKITQPFAVSTREVTIAEYGKYATARNLDLDEKLADADPGEPIRYVSWEDATRYTDWLTVQSGAKYRLPTEAEWEYVARAGGQSRYFFGDDELQLCTYANLADRSTKKRYREWLVVDCEDGHEKVGAAGTLQANPFGLYDVYGNVSEWVAECGMPEYATAPDDGSEADALESCDSHGYRGGSWDSQPAELRSAYRNTAFSGNDDRGIRLLREL